MTMPALTATALRVAVAWVLLALQACAPPGPLIPAPLELKQDAAKLGADSPDKPQATLRVQALPKPPIRVLETAAPRPPVPADPAASEPAMLNLEQVDLATFAHIAFAEVLKKNVNIDAKVLARRDLVTFRSGQGQSAEQLELAVKLVLKSYGVSAIDVGGVVRVLPETSTLGNLPEIRRGAALPDMPLPLRPIFYLIELQAVRQTDVTNWLRTLFGERVKVLEDAGRNAVLLSGTPDNIKAALEAIAVLDQPLMIGRSSVALTPAYGSADDLAKRLSEVLAAQGYAVHPLGNTIVPGASRYPIVLLPVAALNSVFVFAASDELLKHVGAWAQTLDRPTERAGGRNLFTYAVRHKDADLLAQTLDKMLSGTRSSGVTGGAAAASTVSTVSTAINSSAVVVDKSTNTLIYQASADERQQIDNLLRMLDRPAKAALIEVTVAEMSTEDSAQLGSEWRFNQTFNDGSVGTGSTLGMAGTGGFTYQVLTSAAGSVKLKINALASDNRASILSSPRLMARNGESATIQVGQEVPIVTSVQSTAISSANSSLLTSIQYRSTGVILKVKPVIHSSDQIDLDVSQEVSEAQTTTTGVSNSPTIATRKIDTKLTLRNGATVMLGGLISSNGSDGNAGIPWLKDIPGFGSLFGNRTRSGSKREMVVLITPYIVNDSYEAEALTEVFRSRLGSWAAPTAVLPVPAAAPLVVPPPVPGPAPSAAQP